ncbi:MAG: hypothetical protein IJQ01_02125 [Selenomonadaceae bacterium]|nr:hypothetical protein [Selenomonadaceae bacterium]MBR0102278.1 hypothetical protein [Selenomonadaceae bacterium]
MHGSFWKIAMLLSVLLVAAVICFGFRSMNNIASGKSQSIQLPPAIVNYGRKAMDLAKPVLDKLGIVGDVRPTEIVKEKLQAAGAAVNEATRNFTQ